MVDELSGERAKREIVFYSHAAINDHLIDRIEVPCPMDNMAVVFYFEHLRDLWLEYVRMN